MSRDKEVRRSVRRSWIVAAALAALALIGAVAVVAQDFELPGFLPADDQRPVATPTEGEQVLVLQVDLSSDGQKVTAEIRSQEVVDNFAPKAVARSAGEWEVRVGGEKELVYQIRNPLLDVEAENTNDPENPYVYVPTETLDWTLVVPLYDEGQPLGATSVQVVDLATGEIILETAVGDRRNE